MKAIFSMAKGLYILFCILASFALLFFLYVVLASFKIEFETIFYAVIVLAYLFAIWALPFVKIKAIFKIVSFIFATFFTGLVFLFAPHAGFFEIDTCLNKGGCWDYHRNKCEAKNQSYCIRNRTECENKFNGVWFEEDKYCKIISN